MQDSLCPLKVPKSSGHFFLLKARTVGLVENYLRPVKSWKLELKTVESPFTLRKMRQSKRPSAFDDRCSRREKYLSVSARTLRMKDFQFPEHIAVVMGSRQNQLPTRVRRHSNAVIT